MRYNSICCICGQETPKCETIISHEYMKEKMGFMEVEAKWGETKTGLFYKKYKTLNFCPSCSKKSYTIEYLKTVGSYNQQSY